MKRSWLVLVTLVIVGGLAGIAIAGRPTTVDTTVISPQSTLESTSSAAPATTELPTTTTAVSLTTIGSAVASTTTTTQPLDRSTVRVLVANAADRPGIARTTADLLLGLGYLKATAVNALGPQDATAVYVRPGFEVAAAAVAADLNLAPDRVQPMPEQDITDNDTLGDVIVVLGGDYAG